MVYSAHDDQISNMVVWLHPNNLELDFIPYASQVTFELKYEESCDQESCFHVGVRVNGSEIGFDDCLPHIHGCSYPQFKSLMENRWYKGLYSPDLDAACAQDYNPFGTSTE